MRREKESTLTAKMTGQKDEPVRRMFHQGCGSDVMFSLPGHGISLSPFLNIRKVSKGSTACGKQVSILQFAVAILHQQRL